MRESPRSNSPTAYTTYKGNDKNRAGKTLGKRSAKFYADSWLNQEADYLNEPEYREMHETGQEFVQTAPFGARIDSLDKKSQNACCLDTSDFHVQN